MVSQPTAGPAPFGEPFEVFYGREYRGLVSLARALTGDAFAAQDLAQEAMLATYRSWDQVGCYERPEAFARRVVLNRGRSRWRKGLREAAALARLAARRTVPAELSAEAEVFWSEVRYLPARQGQCVTLFYMEDRAAADIADLLGCSEATVRVHLHRARQTLARRFKLDLDGGQS